MRQSTRALILAGSLAGAFLGLGATQALAQAPAPVPALPDAERRTSYSITAQTGPLNVGFALYGDGTDFGTWIQVYLNGVLVSPSTYTVTSPSGTLATLARPITNAQVTFATAQTGTVQIIGSRRPRRTSQFAENRGVAARDVNQFQTDNVATARERWDAISRGLQVPPGELLSLLPPAATRANFLLGFNASGDLALFSPTGASPPPPVTTGAITPTTILSAGAQTLSVAPTGNPITTLSSWSVQANTQSTTQREFLVNLGMTNTITAGPTGSDKVTLYAGIDTPANTTITQGMWAINTVLTLAANTGSNANYNAQGYELDFNNLNAHRGDADGGAGLASPIAYGLNISGASTFRSTAAIVITGSVDQWNRGIVIANNSAKQASFQDLGHAAVSLDIRGSHSLGLDLANTSSFTAGAIRIPNNSPIISVNNAGVNANIVVLDASNIFQVGGGLPVRISSVTAATNTIDGAFRVAGGLSVVGDIIFGGAAWVNFAPAPVCQVVGDAAFVVNGAAYKIYGKTTVWRADITLGANTTGTGTLNITLPSITAGATAFSGRNITDSFSIGTNVAAAGQVVGLVKYDGTATCTGLANKRYIIGGVYEN